ncbi:MAG TPA: TlpA disulfide reductase family protein [Actinomycetota bacterium]
MSRDLDETVADGASVEDPTLHEPVERGARSRWRLVAFVLAPILLFTWLLASGLGKDPRELPSELEGDPAPTFSLPELRGGGTIDLADLRGQVVVVNFWASWCLPCRDEHPALSAAWDRYRERGVVILGVSFEDTEEGALDYVAELGGDWPLVTDPGSRTAIEYGVFGVPETFVVAPDGTIAAKTTGAVDYEWLTSEIESALRSGGLE